MEATANNFYAQNPDTSQPGIPVPGPDLPLTQPESPDIANNPDRPGPSQPTMPSQPGPGVPLPGGPSSPGMPGQPAGPTLM